MKNKLIIGGIVLAGAGLAVFAWRKGWLDPITGQAICGPGSTFERWTPEMLATLSKWSPAVQEQVRRYGGTCNRKASDVDVVPVEDGPIQWPWQVE